MGSSDTPVEQARAYARDGRYEDAAAVVGQLLAETFGLTPEATVINRDAYSLNSLNGTFTASGTPYFFKFHQEENEVAMAGEYYRAGLLAEAGLPVDQPVHASSVPGRQILVYRHRSDRRFADVLRDLDLSADPAEMAAALAAERTLNRRLIEVYGATLHPITPEQSSQEPIHRLFHERLVDRNRPSTIGGRYASFYAGKSFDFPGLTIGWDELAGLRFQVNGITYCHTLGELFARAFLRLRPEQLAGNGGVTAHGDAHNANVWYEEPTGLAEPRLVMFDPAFAGRHVPALLAEIKATFHNTLAHPLWLYEPSRAAHRYQASASRKGPLFCVEIDWVPSPIRRALLDQKRDIVWRPLLAQLQECRLLPADWREVLRLALFLCPTLVMSLRAGPEPDARAHNPVTSLIGLAIAVAAGSEPEQGKDLVTELLAAIDPA